MKTYPNRTAAWLLRLLMAALLFFGSEILLWIDPPGRAIEDWPLLIVGYIVLGAVVLDLAARFHVRSLIDLMTLAAIYALLNGLLLNPETIQGQFPQRFLTRIIGAHGLLGLEMLGLFLALTAGKNRHIRRLLLGYSIWLGFYWGIWVRWSPPYSDWLMDDVPLNIMLTVGGGALAVVMVLFAIAMPRSAKIQQGDLILAPVTGIMLVVTMLIFLFIRLLDDMVSSDLLIASLVLLILCLGVLWYQRSERGQLLLESHLPPTPLGWAWISISITLFATATILAYSLPLIDFTAHNQLSLMQFGFAGLGTLWLPVIAASVSIHAFDRETRRLG